MAALFGLLVAVSMFIIVGFVSSDDGPGDALVQQGLVILVVPAAVPLVVIFGSGDLSRVAIPGGAMTAACLPPCSAATSPVWPWRSGEFQFSSRQHHEVSNSPSAAWAGSLARPPARGGDVAVLGDTTLLTKTIAVLLAGILADRSSAFGYRLDHSLSISHYYRVTGFDAAP
ncbi:MAG TPA: hypothetical protein VFV13_12650 [Acidimicrobiia bacterium]|nr:hypothetical protein [Acidimicrobiia bacterium]